MQDTMTLYKLIVLYMLSRVDFPLTKAQISDFILDREYTNYLTLQSVFAQLNDGKMTAEKTLRNRTQLTLTEEGRSTLDFFKNRLSREIKEDVDAFLKESRLALREEASVTGDYRRLPDGSYTAQLCVVDKGSPLIELSLNVPTEEIAEGVCRSWESKNQEIYQYLISQLF